MNITVVGSRVFVRPDKLPDMTESGSLHLVNYRADSTMKGTVVAIGDGPEFLRRAVDGVLNTVSDRSENKYVQEMVEQVRDTTRFEHLVTVGDRVLFSPSSGEEVIFEKDVFVVMREDDILAVIDVE